MHYYSASREKVHFKKETMVQVDAREAIFGTSLNNFNSENKSDSPHAKLLEMAVQTK